ncbi:MAG: PAS domain S-box protein [Synechococcaceae cyanobacterium RM1_1_27]|nr:PAS domain S-box protein [Synechococcaceae cyanobacterium RM1_1_27]
MGRGLLLSQGINLAVLMVLVGWAIQMLRQQHRIEVDLRQDRDFTTTLINSAGMLVWVMDPEGKIIRFNIACERLLGYGMEEVLGRFIYDLNIFSPQSWTTFQDFLSGIHTSQRVQPQMDLYCRHRQGSVRLVRFYNSAIYGSDGKAEYITCMGIDITQQKQAQKALTDSEERYRDLFEGAHDLIQSVSPDGRFLFVNRAWLQRLGYQPDQVKSLRLYDVVHPKFRPTWNTMILRATVGDPIDQIESLFMTQQGGLVAVEGSLSIRKEHGQVHSIRGIFRDVTRSKQAEEAIRRQNQRNKLFSDISLKIRRSLQINKILQTTVDEVCVTLAADRVLIYQFQPDRSGCVVVEARQNQRWTALQGTLLRDPCFEQDFFDGYSQGRALAIDDIETGPLSSCYIQSLQQWQVKAALVMPVFLQDTLWGLLIVHQCSSPRHWRQGEIELLTQLATQLGIALSQGHLLEQEQEQRRQLAQRNDQLQQAQQVAEAAAAAKGIFLATMSHEVRTPLNAMLGTTELLQNTTLTSEQADLISTLQESGHALLELVNGILDLTKLEAGGIHLDRQTFDLREVLEHSLDRFALAAEAKEVAVDLHIEPDVPLFVQGDPTRLRQILDHLLSNAVKFTDQGGVAVEVSW